MPFMVVAVGKCGLMYGLSRRRRASNPLGDAIFTLGLARRGFSSERRLPTPSPSSLAEGRGALPIQHAFNLAQKRFPQRFPAARHPGRKRGSGFRARADEEGRVMEMPREVVLEFASRGRTR